MSSVFIRCGLVSVLLLSLAHGAAAAGPDGCDVFPWPVTRERAALAANDLPRVESGAELAALPAGAIRLALKPLAEAALPATPERAPAAERFAGFVRIRQVARPGATSIALAAAGWVDVVQNGKLLKPAGFSGAPQCPGLRKLVRYDLGPGETLLQLSGVSSDSLVLAILPVE